VEVGIGVGVCVCTGVDVNLVVFVVMGVGVGRASLDCKCDPKGSMAFLQNKYWCSPVLRAPRISRTFRCVARLFGAGRGERRREVGPECIGAERAGM
jgi:hypothetical protein